MQDTVSLRINEIFYSIQGESLLAGKPTAFIRTAACNLRCTWCDTRYAFWEGKRMTLPEILSDVEKFSAEYVCVTGGEPMGQKGCIPLLEALLEEKYTVSLETSGSFSIAHVPAKVIKVMDIKCPDSGETESMLWENLRFLLPHDQIKFVVASKADFDWAQKVMLENALEKKCPVLFSPVHGKVSPKELAAWILDSHVPVTMQLQLHKEIWGPDQRGV